MLTDASRLADFPALGHMTYLNTAAEGIPSPAVGDALAAYLRDKTAGMDGREAHFAQWHAALERVAEQFGLSADEVSICSCSSEAYNLAALALNLQPGDEVVINDLDFPAGATPWLQARCPATARLWRSRSGALHTADLVPLCHPLPLTHVDVDLRPRRDGFTIEARVRTDAKTGAEMEALHAVAVCALTVYDMVKAADPAMEIGSIVLVRKTGGKRGEYRRLDKKAKGPKLRR